MSSKVVIRAEGLGKAYRIYEKPHQRLTQRLRRMTRGKAYNEFHALRDFELEVREGETVGIVGRNGSGKSTLLQLLCGTLQPSTGSLKLEGRVSALLELGAGFNAEFSGRENVFLNAAVMGMSRDEAESRYADIVRFADIGRHIDHPVKTYSSGMYIRLAFAVAISVEPDILVIDEALSVGDEAFQRKCFARIEELRRNGCTILFVSHSASSVIQLCDRAVLIDDGEKLFDGAPKQVIALYQRLLYAAPDMRAAIRREIQSGQSLMVETEPDSSNGQSGAHERPLVNALSDTHERFDPGLLSESMVEYESHGARIIDPHLVNSSGQRVNVLRPGGDYRYRYSVKFDQAAHRVHFGMMIKSLTGIDIFGMASHAEGDAIRHIGAGTLALVEFKFDSNLLPGTYFTNAGCVGASSDEGGERFLHRILDAAMFKVESRKTDRRKAGFVDLSLEPACSISLDCEVV